MPQVFQVDRRSFDPAVLETPATILREGGIVAFPTETVYGVGASARHPEAVERLKALKGRPEGKPFSYHLSSVAEIHEIAGEIPPAARKLLDRYAPGPITLVIPSGPRLGAGTVGVRVPADEVALELIARVRAPLLVPSANPSGEPPALSADEVIRYFGDTIDAVVDAGTVLLKQPSTVVRVDGEGYEILREGIITREMVHQHLEGRRVLFVCTGNTCRSPMAAAIYRARLAQRLGKAIEDLQELGYRISSAGTLAAYGAPASEYAVDVLRERGLDLSRHVSQPVTIDLLTQVDRVFALGHSHLELLESLSAELEPASRPRVDMLRQEGVVDPVGGNRDEYRRCADQIEAALLKHLPG